MPKTSSTEENVRLRRRVGAAIRRAREARGWSQLQLARAMRDAARQSGLPLAAAPHALRSMISQWETGRRLPSRLNLALLHAVLGQGWVGVSTDQNIRP